MDNLTLIISEALRMEIAKITPKLSIHEIPTWNSLSHIELVVAIEAAYKIQLSEDEIVAMRSVACIREMLRKRGVLS